MSKISDDLYIKVPRNLIYNEYENDNIKGGVLLLYCYIYRFSTRDGFFKGSIQDIITDCGSHYNSKSKRVTNFVKTVARCISILNEQNIIHFENEVDTNDYFAPIFLTINDEYLQLNQKYVSISFSQFDYLIKINTRINKFSMFMLLFWILNCSSKMKSGQIIDACSYSIAYMMKALNLNEATVLKYLSILCGEPGSDAPIIRTTSRTLKIQGNYRRFPNIYVKNDKNYNENIKNQMRFMGEQFKQGKVFEYEFDDLDGLFS